MKLFCDSSAFAKRFIEEAGSPEVEEACLAASELAVSILCSPEIISGLNRRVREKSLTHQQYRLAKQRLFEDLDDVTIVNVTPDVVSRSFSLLESNLLRAMDALHLASALAWKADLFLSSDQRQLAAAKKTGLKVRGIV